MNRTGAVKVAQNYILLYRGFTIRWLQVNRHPAARRRAAECNSAIWQITNLRYCKKNYLFG